jgi:recombinational DNA repair ATPase RecF
MRRAAVLELAREHPQVFLTTTEIGNLGTAFDAPPQVWHIEAGTLVLQARP